jgi:hypothetical protein
MRFLIQHRLHYHFGRPVFLEPHTVRLTPRQDPGQRLLRHSLQLGAKVRGRSEVLDANGNSAVVLWFDDLREELELTVAMEVETLRQNPFDWIFTDPAAATLPLRYAPETADSLQPFLANDDIDPAVVAWAAEQAKAVDQGTAAFVMALADTIHHGFHHAGRPEGDPFEPAETLANRPNADLTDALRDVQGVSVSGGSNNQDVYIRGLPGSYTLILVDGKRQSTRDSRVGSRKRATARAAVATSSSLSTGTVLRTGIHISVTASGCRLGSSRRRVYRRR